MDQYSVLSANDGLEGSPAHQLNSDSQGHSDGDSRNASLQNHLNSQNQSKGPKVTKIYANTYAKAFSIKEIQVLESFISKKGRIHFKKMQKKLYDQCGYYHQLGPIRRQWGRIIRKLKPSKDHIIQYIQNMIEFGWVNYNTITKHIVDSPFQNGQVARQFFKRVYIKTMKAVEKFIQKYFFRSVERLTHQDKKKIAKMLTVGTYQQKNVVRPTFLRYCLITLYVHKLKGIKTPKNDIMTTYSIMTLVKQQYLSHEMEINCRGRLGYAWSFQQLRELYQLYIQYGIKFAKISKHLCLRHGEHQKYNYSLLLAVYTRLLRQAFFISIKNRMDYVFSYRLDSCDARALLLSKEHPHFSLMIKLVSVFFGQQYSKQQMNQIYDFIGKLIQQKNQYKRKFERKQETRSKKKKQYQNKQTNDGY